MEKKSIEKLHFQLSELKEKISNGLKIKVPQNAVAGTCIRVKFPSNWTTLCDNLIAELASAQKPPCEHACILCPNGFGLQDFQEGGVECDSCGEMILNDVAPCQEVCGCTCDESDDGIDSANIISDKREKRSVERYQDDEYKKLLLDDIPPEELNAALEDEVSSSDEEEIEVRSDDEEWKEDDEEEWKEDDEEEWKEDDEEWKEDDEEDRRLRETCGW